jgi:hypothetical protein
MESGSSACTKYFNFALAEKSNEISRKDSLNAE